MGLEPVGGGKPLYDESALSEKQDHWYQLLKHQESLFDLLMDNEDTANEIAESEYAMRAVFWLDLQENT